MRGTALQVVAEAIAYPVPAEAMAAADEAVHVFASSKLGGLEAVMAVLQLPEPTLHELTAAMALLV